MFNLPRGERRSEWDCDIYKVESDGIAPRDSYIIRYDPVGEVLYFLERNNPGNEDNCHKKCASVRLKESLAVNIGGKGKRRWLEYDSILDGRYGPTCPHSESPHLTSVGDRHQADEA